MGLGTNTGLQGPHPGDKQGGKVHPKHKDGAEVCPGGLADLKTSILPHSSALGHGWSQGSQLRLLRDIKAH